jgi:hypothetical protein
LDCIVVETFSFKNKFFLEYLIVGVVKQNFLPKSILCQLHASGDGFYQDTFV